MNEKSKNERMKRKYFRWLREAEGFSERTVDAVEKAIWNYEDFADNEDLGKFCQTKAVSFKKHLLSKKHNGTPLSPTTVYHYLRHVKDFFAWLSDQQGYKSKIDLSSVSYLTLEKKLVREASSKRLTRIPSLEYVKELCQSIEVHSEIDVRDQALIAFLFLSGMRDSAVASLPLGCYDPKTHIVSQDPSRGVATKFSKCFYSRLLPFDDELLKIVDDWAAYLSTDKCYGTGDPLFPRTKVGQLRDSCTLSALGIEPIFWKGGSQIRQVLVRRSEAAGLEYYKPHSFRHAAIQNSLRYCRTAEEIKAMSQNFGHENIGTTMLTYGKLRDQDVIDVVSSIDFSQDKSAASQSDVAADLRKLLKKIEQK